MARRFGQMSEEQVERRTQVQERRRTTGMPVSAERRSKPKPRRKLRNFQGSPPPDHILIDIADEDVVRYWAQELEVSEDELKSSLQKVGSTVKAVREHFGK